MNELEKEEKRMSDVSSKEEFEKLIQKKINEIAEDYDLDDLNSNDKLVLRALAQAFLGLEETEFMYFKSRREDRLNVDQMERLGRTLNSLRKDISTLQGDLSITRKVRKNDKEASVADAVEEIKRRAKDFLESRMSYIYCPKCNMLLGSVWVLYTEDKSNRVTLTCNRRHEDGNLCGEVVNVKVKDLIEKRGTNVPSITPESML